MATAVGVPRGTRGRALANLVFVAFLLVLVWMGLPSRNVSFAFSKTSQEVTILDARLANRNIKGADAKHPLVLKSDADTPFSMRLQNNTDQPIDVEFARFEGRSLAIAFLHYDLALKTRVPAHDTKSIDATVNFYSLDRAATGYLQASLRVYNHETHAIGQERFVVDVKGKTASQVGLVTIELALLAVACLVEIIVRAFRNSLPGNRFVRGLVFGFTGAVIAVAIVLATAALRIALMPAHTWVPAAVRHRHRLCPGIPVAGADIRSCRGRSGDARPRGGRSRRPRERPAHGERRRRRRRLQLGRPQRDSARVAAESRRPRTARASRLRESQLR